AAVGGTASVLTGGKFANGAVSAAFAHLFNDEAHAANSRYFWQRGFWEQGWEELPTRQSLQDDDLLTAIRRFTPLGRAISAVLWIDSQVPPLDMSSDKPTPPEQIGPFKDHGWERMQEDGISWREAQEAFKQPPQWQEPQRTWLYETKTVRLVLDEE